MILDKQLPLRIGPELQQETSPEQSNFFISSLWLNAYVEEWSRDACYGLLRSDEDGDVRVAAISKGMLKSRLGINYVSLGFNEASERLVQNLTLEFNDFVPLGADQKLLDVNLFRSLFDQSLSLLLAEKGWQELRVSAVSNSRAEVIKHLAANKNLIVEVFSERKTYWIDLCEIRKNFGEDFILSRSANTRAQLRKALRTTELTLGACSLRAAESVEEAQIWLNELGNLHSKKWNQAQSIEGFTNPRFVAFHRKLITSMWPKGEVQILRIQAGKSVLGYLHMFVVGGYVYFNMSGIDYDQPLAKSPGLICHWFAINYYHERQARIYDFLAGDNRYKQSLCTHQLGQTHLLLRKKTWYFVLESALRKLKVYVTSRDALK